jgi:hypothetical protein
MPICASQLPPLPSDTVRAAEAVFGKGNIYLTIGDQVVQMLTDIDIACLDPAREQPASSLAVLALVTIFQFVEGLPDRRAVEAIRIRLDWKYALHRPLVYPDLEHLALCRFRQDILSDPTAREVFQQVLDRLARADLLRGADISRSRVSDVVSAVCAISRLDQLVEAMHVVLEVLAAIEPGWLLGNSLPHWYERYNRILARHVLPHSPDEQVSLALAIGRDAHHLLETLASGAGDLAQLPEARALRQIWHQQFGQAGTQIEWRLPVCAACLRAHRLSDDSAFQP